MDEIKVEQWRVCGGCQCWCDDIPSNTDVPSNPADTDWGPACQRGQAWLDHHVPESTATAPSEESAGDQAVFGDLSQRLLQAKRPAILGLVDLDLDAQRWAVAIADRSSALLDPCLSPSHRAKLLALQQTGQVTATWGELRQRANRIVYWNCDPEQAPRFRERYGDLVSRDSRAEVPQAVAIGSQVQAHQWTPQIPTLRLSDQELLDQLENESLRDPALQQQVASWESGTYTAWVIGSSPEGDWPQQQMAMERLTRWIAKHNHRQRMVAVPWGGGQGNATGAVSVLTWRTGYPMSVDFAEGHPTYQPGEYFWENALQDESVDFVLWLGGVPEFAVPIVQSIREARPALPWYQLSRNVAPFSGAIHLASSALTSNVAPTSQPHGIPRHLIQRPDGMILPANTGATNTASQLELLLRRMTQSQSPVVGQ